MSKQLLVFGPGYTAQPLIRQAQDQGWDVYASYRTVEKRQQLMSAGLKPFDFAIGEMSISSGDPLHILVSIAPKAEGDPTLKVWKSWLEQQNGIESTHYLSSTNIYGDHQGGWVDESTTPTPSLDRGKRRLAAEKEWQSFAKKTDTRLFIYRLAGIYGPGRNAIASLNAGRARCIIKENQIFSRIHVEDIRAAVWAAITGNHPGGIFNLADDEPTPPHVVVEAAANILGRTAPLGERWETAELSEMARSFYLESKRVKNTKVKEELGVTLQFPNYRTGLKALAKTEG